MESSRSSSSIVLSHLLANEITKRVIDTVIDKVAASDDLLSSPSSFTGDSSNSVNNHHNNITVHKQVVLSRLKSLWLENLAAIPSCGVTVNQPLSASNPLLSTGPSISTRLTDPVPLSPECYTHRGIRLAAPYLPPPPGSMAFGKSSHSSTQTIGGSSNSVSNPNSSSSSNDQPMGMYKVLEWRHKLVPKRVSSYIFQVP